jgi:hypothetical protein
MDSVKQYIERWCREEGWMSLVDDMIDSSAELHLTLSVLPPGSFRRTPLLMTVRQLRGTDRLVIEHQVPLPTGLFATMMAQERQQMEASSFELNQVLAARPGLLAWDLKFGENRSSLTVAHTLWLDGFNKNTFLTALIEMVKTDEILSELFYRLTVA